MEDCYLNELEEKEKQKNFFVYLCEERNCENLERDGRIYDIYFCKLHHIYKNSFDVQEEKKIKVEDKKIFEFLFKKKI